MRKKGQNSVALVERFLDMVTIYPDGCWLWRGAVNKNGYGSMWDGKHAETASRLAYTLLVGKIPARKFVLHRCDVPLCVRPSHLYVGTHKNNMEDRKNRGRARGGRGERNSHAKLTNESVRSIRLSQLPIKRLAEIYKVAIPTISNIRTRKTWSFLP